MSVDAEIRLLSQECVSLGLIDEEEIAYFLGEGSDQEKADTLEILQGVKQCNGRLTNC